MKTFPVAYAALWLSSLSSSTTMVLSQSTPAPSQEQVPDTVFNVTEVEDDLFELSNLLYLYGLSDVIAKLPNATLFAPTNDAFAQFNSSSFSKFYLVGWEYHMSLCLARHLVNITLMSNDFVDNTTLTTYVGETVLVNVGRRGVVTLDFGLGLATVTEPDLLAGNGVVHKIDTFMITAFAAFNVETFLKAVTTFNTILSLAVTAGIEQELQDTDMTFFAPTDSVFMALSQDTLDFLNDPANIDTLTTILLDHIVLGPDIWPSYRLETQPDLTTQAGSTLTVRLDQDKNIILGGLAKVIYADGYVGNGYAHGIDALLLLNMDTSAPTPSASDMASDTPTGVGGGTGTPTGSSGTSGPTTLKPTLGAGETFAPTSSPKPTKSPVSGGNNGGSPTRSPSSSRGIPTAAPTDTTTSAATTTTNMIMSCVTSLLISGLMLLLQ